MAWKGGPTWSDMTFRFPDKRPRLLLACGHVIAAKETSHAKRCILCRSMQRVVPIDTAERAEAYLADLERQGMNRLAVLDMRRRHLMLTADNAK